MGEEFSRTATRDKRIGQVTNRNSHGLSYEERNREEEKKRERERSDVNDGRW
jgi:hypothetical protein